MLPSFIYFFTIFMGVSIVNFIYKCSYLHYGAQAVAEVDQQKQEFHLIAESQEGLQKQNFYPVDAMNLEEVYNKWSILNKYGNNILFPLWLWN